MKHNMKIEINAEQPLDEVVKELERLGFRPWCVEPIDNGFVVTNKKGLLTTYHKDIWDQEEIVTLQQLREMK